MIQLACQTNWYISMLIWQFFQKYQSYWRVRYIYIDIFLNDKNRLPRIPCPSWYTKAWWPSLLQPICWKKMVVSHWLVCAFSSLFIKIMCKFREIYSRVERKSHNQMFHAVWKFIRGMSWKYLRFCRVTCDAATTWVY